MERLEKLFEDMRRLVKEINELNKPILTEAVLPIEARNLLDLAERVVKAWNRGYSEYTQFRPMIRDIFATFGLQAIAKKENKAVSDIRQESETSLANKIKWVADRFVNEFQQHLVKKSGDLRADLRKIISAGRNAESIADPELRDAVVAFHGEYLPFEQSISKHLYRSANAISRYAQAIVDKYMPPESKLPKPPKGGSRTPPYYGKATEDPAVVSERAADSLEHIDTFMRLTEPVLGEVEEIVSLAAELVKDMPPPEPETEPEEPKLEPEPIPKHENLAKRHRWLRHDWESDPEIDTSL